MRKLIALLLAAAAAVGVVLLNNSIITEPPGLTLVTAEGSVPASAGGYTWGYTDLFGRSTGDVSDPVTLRELTEPLFVLEPRDGTVTLDFTARPHRLQIRAWPAGSPEAGESGGEVLELEDLTLELLRGDNVYEVTAVWYTKRYDGRVIYYFEGIR